jgi:hypothetical protein
MKPWMWVALVLGLVGSVGVWYTVAAVNCYVHKGTLSRAFGWACTVPR